MELKMKWKMIERGGYYFLQYKKFLFWHDVKLEQVSHARRITSGLDFHDYELVEPCLFFVSYLVGFCTEEIADVYIRVLDKMISGTPRVVKVYDTEESTKIE